MINLLKSNNPAAVLLYVLYLLLFRAVMLFHHIPPHTPGANDGPLYRLLVSGWLDGMPYQTQVSIALASMLLLLQAWMVNRLVNSYKFTAKKNYVAGAIYLIAISVFPQSLHISPTLLTATLLIIVSNRLFGLHRKEKLNSDIFDTGFLVALATLLHYPAVIFLLYVYLGLLIVRPFVLRELIIVLTGVASPLILLFTLYFVMDWHFPPLSLSVPAFSGISMHEVPAALYLSLWALAGFALMPGVLYAAVIQVRKYVSILGLMALLTFAYVLPQQPLGLSNLMLLAFPVSITSTMVTMQIKRQWIPELIHIILLLLALAGQFIDATL